MKQLLEFQRKVNAIKKDGKNPHFKSTYATLTQILSEVKPILSDIGLVLLQPIKDGKVGTILLDESGKEIATSYIDLGSSTNGRIIMFSTFSESGAPPDERISWSPTRILIS